MGFCYLSIDAPLGVFTILAGMRRGGLGEGGLARLERPLKHVRLDRRLRSYQKGDVAAA
jgi:hypothetical protein